MPYTINGYVPKKNYPTTDDNHVAYDYAVPLFCNRDYARAKKNFEGSLKLWRQGYDLQEPYYGARMCTFWGMCEQRLGNIQEAIRIFEEALKIDSNMAAIYMRLGQCYAALGDHTRALQYYDIVANNPGAIWVTKFPELSAFNTDRVFYLRAVSRNALKDRQGAIADCRKALALRNGNYPKVANFLKQLENGGVVNNPNNLGGIPPQKVIEYLPNGQTNVQYYQQNPFQRIIDFTPQPQAPNPQQQFVNKLAEKQPVITDLLQQESHLVKKQGLTDLAYRELLDENNQLYGQIDRPEGQKMWAERAQAIAQEMQAEYNKIAQRMRELRDKTIEHLDDFGYSPDQLKGNNLTEKLADMLLDKGIEMMHEFGAINEQIKKNLKFIKEFGYKRVDDLSEQFDNYSEGPQP